MKYARKRITLTENLNPQQQQQQQQQQRPEANTIGVLELLKDVNSVHVRNKTQATQNVNIATSAPSIA